MKYIKYLISEIMRGSKRAGELKHSAFAWGEIQKKKEKRIITIRIKADLKKT